MSTWVGLDISKDTIDVGYFIEEKGFHFKIENTSMGFKKLIKEIPADSQVVMEATGVYYLKCAQTLVERNIFVSVENPLRIKRFSQMNLRRSKTDKKDALLIAKYGEFNRPAHWNVPTKNQLQSQQLLSAIDLQVKTITQFKNQFHAFSHSGIDDKFVLRTLQKGIINLEKTKLKLEAELLKIIKIDFKEEFDLINSIPSIGETTACIILTKVGDCSSFETSRQLASFFGITPSESFSGTSIHKKGGISKMGSSRVRRQLYMCSLSAIRYNSLVKPMYLRMREKGKHNKIILVAIMNKLVRQMFGVLKSRKPYDPSFI